MVQRVSGLCRNHRVGLAATQVGVNMRYRVCNPVCKWERVKIMYLLIPEFFALTHTEGYPRKVPTIKPKVEVSRYYDSYADR